MMKAKTGKETLTNSRRGDFIMRSRIKRIAKGVKVLILMGAMVTGINGTAISSNEVVVKDELNITSDFLPCATPTDCKEYPSEILELASIIVDLPCADYADCDEIPPEFYEVARVINDLSACDTPSCKDEILNPEFIAFARDVLDLPCTNAWDCVEAPEVTEIAMGANIPGCVTPSCYDNPEFLEFAMSVLDLPCATSTDCYDNPEFLEFAMNVLDLPCTDLNNCNEVSEMNEIAMEVSDLPCYTEDCVS